MAQSKSSKPVIASTRNKYFLDGEGIEREVLQNEICKYLDNDATCRPSDYNGRKGYDIFAYRNFTKAQVDSIKEMSTSHRRLKEQAHTRTQMAPSSRKRPRDEPAQTPATQTQEARSMYTQPYKPEFDSPPPQPPRFNLLNTMPPNGVPTPQLQRAEMQPPYNQGSRPHATPPYSTTPDSAYSRQSSEGSRGYKEGLSSRNDVPRVPELPGIPPDSRGVRAEHVKQEWTSATTSLYPQIAIQYQGPNSATRQTGAVEHYVPPSQPFSAQSFRPPGQRDDGYHREDVAMDTGDMYTDLRANMSDMRYPFSSEYEPPTSRFDRMDMDVDMEPRREWEPREDEPMRGERDMRGDWDPRDRDFRGEEDIRDPRAGQGTSLRIQMPMPMTMLPPQQPPLPSEASRSSGWPDRRPELPSRTFDRAESHQEQPSRSIHHPGSHEDLRLDVRQEIRLDNRQEIRPGPRGDVGIERQEARPERQEGRSDWQESRQEPRQVARQESRAEPRTESHQGTPTERRPEVRANPSQKDTRPPQKGKAPYPSGGRRK